MAAKKKAAAKKAPKAVPKTKAPGLAKASAPPAHHEVRLANQAYELRDVSTMQPHPENPKRGNLEAIGESLEENDFYGAAIVQKSTGFILVGNHRYKSAVQKGLKAIPVIVVDCDDEKARKIMLADNRTADLGNYDDKKRLALLDSLIGSAHGLRGTGFADSDLAKMRERDTPPAAFPEYDGQVKVLYKCPSCKFEWS